MNFVPTVTSGDQGQWCTLRRLKVVHWSLPLDTGCITPLDELARELETLLENLP